MGTDNMFGRWDSVFGTSCDGLDDAEGITACVT